MAVTYCPREEMGEGVHHRHQLWKVEDGRQGDPVDPLAAPARLAHVQHSHLQIIFRMKIKKPFFSPFCTYQ